MHHVIDDICPDNVSHAYHCICIYVLTGLIQLSELHENQEDLIPRLISVQQVSNMLGTDHGTADPSGT